MKEASDQDGPGLPAFTQATFPPCMGARLQCIRCTLDSTAWGTPTVPGGFPLPTADGPQHIKTHISHNALVKIDPTLYWKCPPFLIQVKHGIRCLSSTPVHTSPTVHWTTLPRTSTTAQPSHDALGNLGCSETARLSRVPQNTDFTVWGREEI